jgi:hypothetical protein
MSNVSTEAVIIPEESSISAVSWAAIAAGAVVSAAFSLFLMHLVAGLGLVSISPWAGSGVSASTIHVAGGISLVLMAVMASALAGYLAARLPGGLQRHEGVSRLVFVCVARRAEGSGVTVTCLMPGATETEFFERADMLETKVGQQKKQDPRDVAKAGFDAMMDGKGDVVTGWQNVLRSAIANITPTGMLAEQHRAMAEPGSARRQ